MRLSLILGFGAAATGVTGAGVLGATMTVKPPVLAALSGPSTAAVGLGEPSTSPPPPGPPAHTLDLPERSRVDLLSADPRLRAVLDALNQHWSLRVGVVRTGHSQCVGGASRRSRPRCPVSNHWCGRAVDLFGVDGPVTYGNAAAHAAALWLLSLPPPLRPDEVGGPWGDLARHPGGFSDRAHRTHIHLGYEGPIC